MCWAQSLPRQVHGLDIGSTLESESPMTSFLQPLLNNLYLFCMHLQAMVCMLSAHEL